MNKRDKLVWAGIVRRKTDRIHLYIGIRSFWTWLANRNDLWKRNWSINEKKINKGKSERKGNENKV